MPEDDLLSLLPDEVKNNFYLFSLAALQLDDSLLRLKNPITTVTREKTFKILQHHLKQLYKDADVRSAWLKKPLYVTLKP